MANTYIDAPVTEQTEKNNRYYWTLDDALTILPKDCLGEKSPAKGKGTEIDLIVAGQSMPQDMVLMGKQVRPRNRGAVLSALTSAYGKPSPGQVIRLKVVNAALRQYEVTVA